MADRGREKARAMVDRAALLITRPVIKPPYARKGNGARAHRAGLKRDIEIATDEALRP